MIILSLATALAGTLTVPDDGALDVVIGAAPPGSVIRIDGSVDHTTSPIAFAKDLTLVGFNGTPELPTLVITDAEVRLEQLSLAGSSVVEGLSRSLVASNAAVQLDTVSMPSIHSIGLSATESLVDISELHVPTHGLGRSIQLVRSQAIIRNSSFSDHSNGAILSEGSVLDLANVSFSGNSGENGGDVLAHAGGTFTAQDVTSDDATASANGGSIALLNVNAQLIRTTLRTPTAGQSGGAIHIRDDGLLQTPIALNVSLDQTYIQGATASSGGAISSAGQVALLFRDSLFQNNWADNGGAATTGGVIYQSNGWLTLENTTMESFWANSGGAIFTVGTSVSMFDSTLDGRFEVSSESGSLGGAIALNGGDLDVVNTEFINLQVFSGGAAISAQGADLTIADSRFAHLFATSSAGAITQSGGTTEIYRTHFEDVSAGSAGVLYSTNAQTRLHDVVMSGSGVSGRTGAISVADPVAFEMLRARVCGFTAGVDSIIGFRGSLGPTLIAASTLTANQAGDGGVIGHNGTMTDTGVLNIDHVTLVDNTGLGLRASGPLKLTNSLVVGHDVAMAGPGFAADRNLFFDNDLLTTDAADVGSNAIEEDPLFTDRSGACGADLTLQPGSPAIGIPSLGATGGPNASAIDRDQDGWPEGQDCDDYDPTVFPGAFEIVGDGRDTDCDGLDGDEDGDGFSPPFDCDDSDPEIHPLASDTPNDGRDQDCSGHATTSTIGGRGCTHAVRSPSTWTWLLVMTLFVRRRS
ncbi:MAG: putative metal-binding motif-containing protein [Proteobacteria bacterium]|nr:putative metal-binding motif-containing protein [Pseudomonadota bacterium]